MPLAVMVAMNMPLGRSHLAMDRSRLGCSRRGTWIMEKKAATASKDLGGRFSDVMSPWMKLALGTFLRARSIWRPEMSTPVTSKRSDSCFVVGVPAPQPISRSSDPRGSLFTRWET